MGWLPSLLVSSPSQSARTALVREALAPLCRPAGTALVEYCLLCTGTGEWPGARQLVSAMAHEKTTTVGELSSGGKKIQFQWFFTCGAKRYAGIVVVSFIFLNL